VTPGPPLSQQDEDWQRFRRLAFTTNHWDRPNWTPGRQAYYWYLTFDSAELRTLAHHCQSRLRLPYLDLVPLDGLHLTLPKVGWSDEVPSEDAGSVAAAALRACSDLEPFTLTVGPLAGSAGAVRFSVAPWEPVIAIYQRLRESVRTVRNEGCKDSEFRPHVGIPYCNDAVPADPLGEAIAPLRSLPSVDIMVTHVDLVLLRREGQAYKWSTIHSLPLG
jgi:2'-5' RNA ligase